MTSNLNQTPTVKVFSQTTQQQINEENSEHDSDKEDESSQGEGDNDRESDEHGELKLDNESSPVKDD